MHLAAFVAAVLQAAVADLVVQVVVVLVAAVLQVVVLALAVEVHRTNAEPREDKPEKARQSRALDRFLWTQLREFAAFQERDE